MSEWKEVKLGDVLLKITKGTTPPRGKGFVDEGINYIKSDAIGYDGRIDDSLFVRIDEETHDKFKRSKLEKDDILFSMAGVFLGKNAIVKEEHLPANTNQALAIIRLNQDLAKPKFVSYYLRQPAVIEYVNNMSGQSAQPNINFQEISSIEIPLPKIEEQENVIEVLSSLDDKINLLHRQNQTLEQMAETLFRQWFVEEADEGWEKKKLKELVDIGIGRTPPRKEFHWFSKSRTDVKWVSIKDLGDSGIFVLDTTEYLTEEAVEKFNIPIIPPDTVLLSFKMTLGRVAITTEHMLSNEAIAHFKFKENTPFTKEFLYFYLKTYPYETLGSTSSIVTSINSGMIKDMEAIIPDDEALSKFETQVVDYFEKIKSNQSQIRTLITLRDTLLPKLMSGEVRVADTPVIALKKTKEARPEFKEAILIAAIVRTLFTPKIGNVSRQWYQKIAYLHKRKLKELTKQQSVFELTTEYSKKAAGPYKKKMRYQGPEGICLKNKYLEAVNDYAFKPSEDIHKIDNYFDNYWNKDLFVNWTIEKFRFVPVKKLGVYATVDYSLLELKKEGKELSASNVLNNISESKDWKHKKDLPEFSPQNIKQAVNDLKNLYTY